MFIPGILRFGKVTTLSRGIASICDTKQNEFHAPISECGAYFPSSLGFYAQHEEVRCGTHVAFLIASSGDDVLPTITRWGVVKD